MASLILNVTSKAKIFSRFSMLSYFTFKGGFQDKMNLDFFFGSKSVEAWSGRVKGDEKSWSFFRGAKARLVVWWLCTTFLCSRDFIPQWSSLESYNYAGIKHLRMVFICHYIFIEFLVSWVGPLPEGIIWGLFFRAFFSGYEWLTSSSKGYFSNVANAR